MTTRSLLCFWLRSTDDRNVWKFLLMLVNICFLIYIYCFNYNSVTFLLLGRLLVTFSSFVVYQLLSLLLFTSLLSYYFCGIIVFNFVFNLRCQYKHPGSWSSHATADCLSGGSPDMCGFPAGPWSRSQRSLQSWLASACHSCCGWVWPLQVLTRSLSFNDVLLQQRFPVFFLICPQHILCSYFAFVNE